MIEQLDSYMQNQYKYEVNDMVEIAPLIKQRKTALIPAGIFVVIVGIYFITRSFPWWVLLIAFVVLFGLYFIFKKPDPHETLIFTPNYLIHEYKKGNYIAVNYDEIVSFSVEEEKIVITTESEEMKLNTSVYQKELEPLIDILEAKGKTFDSTKEYMVRPIEIKIENGEVKLVDIDIVTTTQKLIAKFINNYDMLTPGFIEYIIFLNANISNVAYTDSNLILNIDRLEVHEGHPENTTFDTIAVEECIFIAEDVTFSSFKLRNTRKTEELSSLEPTNENLGTHLKNGVITEWRFEDNSCYFLILEGVHQLQLEFDYEEVIVGWNNTL